MYLALLVYTNQTTAGLVWSCDKDGLSTDSVHVDACSCFQVIHVDVPKFGNHKNDTIFGRDLKGNKLRVAYLTSLILNTSFSLAKVIDVRTCIATGKSRAASGGKFSSTAFFKMAWLPSAGCPTSITCSCSCENNHI